METNSQNHQIHSRFREFSSVGASSSEQKYLVIFEDKLVGLVSKINSTILTGVSIYYSIIFSRQSLFLTCKVFKDDLDCGECKMSVDECGPQKLITPRKGSIIN